jgi:ureidoglycolate hydrolase
MRLKIEPIDAAAFMSFGQLIPPQAPGQGRQELFEELQNERASARPRLSMATVEPKALPLTAVQMERHVHSSQVFVPVDSAGYLVVVAPHGADGMPDLGKIRAFPRAGRRGAKLSRRHLASSVVGARAHGALRNPHLRRRNLGGRAIRRSATRSRHRGVKALRRA